MRVNGDEAVVSKVKPGGSTHMSFSSGKTCCVYAFVAKMTLRALTVPRGPHSTSTVPSALCLKLATGAQE